MTITTNSLVKFNSREQAVSSDVQRVGMLASREMQDRIKNESRRDDFVDPNGFGYNNLAVGDFFPRAESMGGMQAQTGYTCRVLAGRAHMGNGSTNPDISDYSVVQWPDTTLSFAAPDPANTRIDLVYATPAMQDTDLQSRNILVDPVTRSTVPQNVYKTSNPEATIDVATGEPGSNVPPSVPIGSMALWEVVVPANAANSDAFHFIRRVWRKVELLSTFHGILQGCVPKWSMRAESAGAEITLPQTKIHRAVVDGEPMVWSGATPLVCHVDLSNPPIAQSTYDVPCYLYLCGGRNSPCREFPSSPWQLIVSATPPGATGRAGSDLSYPAGLTIRRSGSVYVGVAFIARNSGNKLKSCVIDGDWVYAMTGASDVHGQKTFNEDDVTMSGATQDVVLNAIPATSTTMDLNLAAVLDNTSGNDGKPIAVRAGAGAAADFTVLVRPAQSYGVDPTSLFRAFGSVRTAVPADSTFAVTAATGAIINLAGSGFNMNVPRLSQ